MKMASAFYSAIVCVLVGASCGAVIADADSPSPASQPSGAGARPFARQMESSIDDLMNALAQVTKSKGNNSLVTLVGGAGDFARHYRDRDRKRASGRREESGRWRR